jgi:hypothetical protein
MCIKRHTSISVRILVCLPDYVKVHLIMCFDSICYLNANYQGNAK